VLSAGLSKLLLKAVNNMNSSEKLDLIIDALGEKKTLDELFVMMSAEQRHELFDAIITNYMLDYEEENN